MAASNCTLAVVALLLATISAGIARAEDPGTLEQLETLTVTEEKLSGYDSEFSFKYWIDADGNGCNERADSIRKYVKGGFDGCALPDRGVIRDPYSGLELTFPSKDLKSISGMDIDHIVSRSDAWQTGMANRPQEERDAFANDQLNLVPTEARINRSKSDKTPGVWLSEPSEKSGLENRCMYAQRYVQTKYKYKLSLGRDDYFALKEVLTDARCTPDGDVSDSINESESDLDIDQVLAVASALVVVGLFLYRLYRRSRTLSRRVRTSGR